MTIIGRALLNGWQSKMLNPGAMIDVEVQQMHIGRKKLNAGDLLWVQEGYWEFTPTQFGPQNVFAIVPGPRFPSKTPAHIKNRECKRIYRDGSDLPRASSRATLEIIAHGFGHAACKVHMVNVDEFVKAEAPA